MLACLVQEGEEGDEGMQQLRQEMDELIQKAPQSGSATGKVTEMKALMVGITRERERVCE